MDVFIISKNSPNCVTRRNFELEFLSKVENDPIFAARLEENPKQVLEEEISNYTGRPFVFDENVNVTVFHENPNNFYLMIPPSGGLPNGPNTPLAQALQAIKDREVYGLFMGSLQGLWWHFGLRAGSCVSNLEDEIQEIQTRKCLVCS